MKKIKNIKTKSGLKNIVLRVQLLSLSIIYSFLIPLTVRAEGDNSVDMWEWFVNDVLVFWLVRIGGLVAIIGGVMFALGWHEGDSVGIMRGIKTFVAGVMVIAIAGAAYAFLV